MGACVSDKNYDSHNQIIYLKEPKLNIFGQINLICLQLLQMEFQNISLSDFIGREDELKKIKRFLKYPTMFYRTDLVIHTERVLAIAEELLPLAIKTLDNFDPELVRVLALVHDDAEIVTGDVQLYDKLRMTSEQLAQLDKEEEKALELLAKRFPEKINGYVYKEVLKLPIKKEKVEAQFISLCDKLDAYGESFHEIYAGNRYFINPCETYVDLLMEGKFASKFPLLSPLFKEKHILLTPAFPNYDYEKILAFGKLHTEESIEIDTGNPIYEFWKMITKKRWRISGLIVVKEKAESLK
jgi:5'-deoxynucleotidase YfbR-like HD superfamily hydrolase